MDNKDNEYQLMEKKLQERLQEAEEMVKDDNLWMSLEELRILLEYSW